MKRAALALSLIAVLSACGGGEPESSPPPAVESPASAPARMNRPTFAGTYDVTALNTGREGEPTFTATWQAVPTCSTGTCDTELTVSRPGFTTYAVSAQARGATWRWEPVIQFACPESGAQYEVASGGFEMRPTRAERTPDGLLAAELTGTVRVKLTASGCPTMRLSYDVSAQRSGD